MNPLSKADIANIAKNIRDLRDADAWIEKIQAAGIDTVEINARIAHARETLEKMYRQFGPSVNPL